MRNSLLVYTLILAFSMGTFAQKENSLIRGGNKEYKNKKYKEAEVNYMKALESNKNSEKAGYNLGNSLYKQEQFKESTKKYIDIAQSTKDKSLKSNALHNLGNSLYMEGEYEKSIEAYKNALRVNPEDKDTKYNLEMAKRMLKKQQEQQNKQNKNQDKKDQQNKDNQNQDKDQKDQQKEQEKQKQEQQQQDKQKQQQQQMKKEDAERMLEALKNDEKKTMNKVNKMKAVKAKVSVTEKDW